MDALPTDKTPRNMTLEELNKEETMYYMGGTILVCSLAVIGLVGNLHVLFVYIWRMKQSNHRIFIICLGVLDLITCLIGMPFIVTNFLKPFTFFDTTMCKTLTFYNFFICLSSACVLIVIAVDRYRKICVPYGKQMSQKVAKAMCLTAMMLALLLSWPGFVIYGSTPIKTRDPNITGYECNILADLKDTWYPIIFNGVLLFIAFSSFIVLAVLYSIIGRVVWNHRTFQSNTDDTKTDVTNVKSTDNTGYKNPNFHSGSSDSVTHEENSNHKETDIDKYEQEKSDGQSTNPTAVEMRRRASSIPKVTTKRTTLQRALTKFDRTKRTTFMLFLITLFFFFSYVPYLVLRLVFYTNSDWYPSMTFAGKVTFNTFLWCVYVNNMANPIIYGFCDQRFRNEVRIGYNSIFCRN